MKQAWEDRDGGRDDVGLALRGPFCPIVGNVAWRLAQLSWGGPTLARMVWRADDRAGAIGPQRMSWHLWPVVSGFSSAITTTNNHHHHQSPSPTITTTDGDAPHIFAMPRHLPKWTKPAEVVLNTQVGCVEASPSTSRTSTLGRSCKIDLSSILVECRWAHQLTRLRVRICVPDWSTSRAVRRSQTTPSAWGNTDAFLDAHCLEDSTSDTSGRTLASDLNAIAAVRDDWRGPASSSGFGRELSAFAPTHSDPVHCHGPSRPRLPSLSFCPALALQTPIAKTSRME